MKKQVFLLADIGLGKDRSFHVGDEAMFFCNLYKYVKNNYKIVASSRSISHKSEKFTEVLDIYILNKPFFIWLLLCAIAFKYLRVNIFPRQFKPTLRALVKSDLLHISGGGNINSFWPGHIHYRSLMIFIATLFGIPIIATSQTIGPINSVFHRKILRWVLNKVRFIGLRDNSLSLKTLEVLRIIKPKIKLMIDDTLGMGENNTDYNNLKDIAKKLPDEISIGVSVHRWKGAEQEWIIGGLKEISLEYPKACFYGIPHQIDSKNSGDIGYVQEIFNKASVKNFKVLAFEDIIKCFENIETVPNIIKKITSEMDIVISSRYHGLVFATFSSIPSISINYDKYYKAKNIGFLSNYYKKPFVAGSKSELLNCFSEVLSRSKNLNKNLIQTNIIINNKYDNFLEEVIGRYS